MKNKEIMTKQHEKKNFHTMKVNIEKAIEVTISSKEMLQHVDMKPLKEKCDMDDKDELQ